MTKKLIALLIAGSFANLASAACTDADLTPDLYQSISTNDTMGALQAKYPCGLPTPSSYKDAIGRDFQVYTWSTLNKSMTIQVYEGRVFDKSGTGLKFQSTSTTPPAASFDNASKVLSLPVLTVSNGDGASKTYYDAQVSLTENGNWAILGMDETQRGDVRYDTRGYTAASYDSKTGQLVVPNLATADGTAPFNAKLGADGTWSDTSATAGTIARTTLPEVAPPDASFNTTSRVMTLPVLTLKDADGKTTTYYDAKIALTENGGWSILSLATEHKGSEIYDLTQATAAALDMSTGQLVVPNLDVNGSTIAFRAALASNGTWTDQSDLANQGVVTYATKTTVTPANPAYDSKTNVMSLPVLAVTGSDGTTTTYYDAKISLTESGSWTILGMSDAKTATTTYNTADYLTPKFDLASGALVVPTLDNGAGGTLAFRAILGSNGTWSDASNAADKGFIPNVGTVALVATGTSPAGWAGLGTNGVVTVNGTAYRNTDTGCSLPAGDSVSLSVYNKAGSLYIQSGAAANSCPVEAMGSTGA